MPQQPSLSRPPIRIAANRDASTPPDWRHLLWLAFLVAASVAFSFGFACVVPFAAFGAAAALTLRQREGLYITVALWLANQLVGFTVLNYPWTASTFVWGVVLGGVAVLATVSAQSVTKRLNGHGFIIVALAAFIGAFIAYEGSLFVVSATLLGGTENFSLAIVVRILEMNAAAFVGLLVLNKLAGAVGLAPNDAALT